MVVCMALAVAPACGDDDGAGTGEGDSSGGSSSEDTGPDPVTTMTTSADDSSSGGASVSVGESTSTGESTVIVGGQVQDLGAGGAGIPDAAISIQDMPGFETVSDAMGNYEFAPLPPATDITVIVDPNAEYLGSVIALTTPTEDEDSQRLAQISYETVNMQIDILADMMPQPADLEQAIIIVRLLQNTATGATIELDPAPADGTYYAPDSMGFPVLNSSTIDFQLLPVVVYFNVAPGDAGAISITATHPERECTVVHPVFPTIGSHVTLVDVDCPAP